MAPERSRCERCGGTGRVPRGTGYGLDDQHDVCTSCFQDESLGIDNAELGRAMVRGTARRKAISRLLESMLYESTVFNGLTPDEAVDRLMVEREILRIHLSRADERCTSAAVDDAVELAVPLAVRGRLTSGSDVGRFVEQLACRLAADAQYRDPQPGMPPRSSHTRR